MRRAGERVSGRENALVIRRLTRLEPPQLEALVEYGRSALGESALDAWLLPVIAGHGRLYVAEVGGANEGGAGGEIVGAAEVIRCFEEGDLYLEGIYIRPEFQRQGHGSELLKGVMELLAAEGYSRLLATVDPENGAGLGLYEKAGFTGNGHQLDYYGPGRHRLMLAVHLASP